MSSDAVSGVADETGIAGLVRSWTKTASDPLLSEHTLMEIEDGGAWIIAVGEPASAILTLVPTKLSDVGLVELASVGSASRIRLWESSRDELLAEARDRGFKHLEIIDRGGTLAGPDSITVRSIVRMAYRGVAPVGDRPGVETATPSDFDGILDLLQEAFAGHPENGDWTMSDISQRKSQEWYDPSGVFVWLTESTVAGLCWTKVHPDSVGEIYLVSVSADLAGQGVGKALVERGVRYLTTERKCTEVIVYSESANTAAIRLYESVGFKVDRVDSRILLNL